MKLLLDTHVFIWWDSDPGKLSATAAAALHDPANSVWLSVVTVWEIVIKVQLGKLKLNRLLTDIVADQQANGLQLLAITLPHTIGIERLPTAHKDPFDRMLAAQAIEEAAHLVTADAVFNFYPVQQIW